MRSRPIFCLFAILTMVSVASGGVIWLEVEGVAPDLTTGNYDVEPGSDITMIIVADTTLMMIDADILGPGQAKAPISHHVNLLALPRSDGVIQNNGTELITGISLSGYMFEGPFVPAGETIYSFTYTIPDAPGTTVDITGGNVFVRLNWIEIYLLGAATLNIVPEPMTIALLGLGGLFLRRRRS